MAKIRTIKPHITTDEKLSEISRDAELLFVLTLMFVDDAGRMEYSPKRLKMQVFPSERDMSLDIEPLVAELCAQGLFQRYDIAGRRYLCIPNFLKHQKIHKPTASTIEPPPEPPPNVPNVPQGTPKKNREESFPSGEVGKKCEELEVELEVELDSSLPPKNSDFIVEQIFRAYPDNDHRSRGRVLQIPPVDSLAIIGAINKHGVDCVLEGARCYAKAVSQWPPGERQKVYGCAKFFNQEMYLFGSDKWERSDGKRSNSKVAERTNRNREVLTESLNRHLGNELSRFGGERDRVQGTHDSGERPMAKIAGTLPSGSG
jgi:hypothetical protein